MLTDQLSSAELGILLHAADGTTGLHIARPWRLEVNGHLIDLYLDDAARLLAPIARVDRIALGAAVFNLRCAAASLSFETWLSVYPYPHDPGLAVRIVVEPTGLPDRELRELYAAFLSRQFRRPPGLPDTDARCALERAAELEDAKLRWLPVSLWRLAALTTDGEEPADQIRIGMALQRVLLTALTRDVRATNLNQTLIRFGGSPTEAVTP